MDMKMKNVEEEEEEEEEATVNSNSPYKKMQFPGKKLRGWMEMAMRKGIFHGPPEKCLTKKITNTDTCPNQHRYQLTNKDVDKSKSLQLIADRATENKDGLTVNVLDKDGRYYPMLFRQIASTGYFRFMGDGWSEFLGNVGLRTGQSMTIWRLPREEERVVANWRVPGVVRGEEVEEDGRYWFVFVNADEEEVLHVDLEEQASFLDG